MNLKEHPRKTYSVDQHTQAPCYELNGEKFYFAMDDGYDYELRITGKETCTWNKAGETPKSESYKCLKGDDTTYLLQYDVNGAIPRVNHTYVIDKEQRLVTMLICTVGLNPKHPYLISSYFDFGAIRVDGEELPFKRHSFTSDMEGTCVEWHWKTAFYTQHYYYCAHFYRIKTPLESPTITRMTPSSDEWARYVKIKNGLFLFVLTESNSERIVGDKGKFRSNNMAFLQNYNRVYHIGRAYGTGMADGEPYPINKMFGAFGKPVTFDQEFLNAPNPYIV